VGEVVKDSSVLNINDLSFIREKGSRHAFQSINPWKKPLLQYVWIIAGSDREQTKQAVLEDRL
jgi:hypothetical protein